MLLIEIIKQWVTETGFTWILVDSSTYKIKIIFCYFRVIQASNALIFILLVMVKYRKLPGCKFICT